MVRSSSFLVFLVFFFSSFSLLFALTDRSFWESQSRFQLEIFSNLDSYDVVPEGWVPLKAKIPETETIKLVFAIKQRNIEILKETLFDVSDPKSENYGKHLTPTELIDLVSPNPETVEKVKSWLHAYGVVNYNITLANDFIVARVPFVVAESLLHCTYEVFFNSEYRQFTIRTRSYTVPSALADTLDFVGGTIRFPSHKMLPKIRTENSPFAGVTPSVIKNRYNISIIGTNPSNLQSVNQFLGQFYDSSDLQKFFSHFSIETDKTPLLVGPNTPNRPGIEAMLDIEYIMGVAANVSTWFVSTAGFDNGHQEAFIEWLYLLVNDTLNGTVTPWVNSVSYGDVESSISNSYLERCDAEFMKLGSLGKSVLYASGDSGVGCTSRCQAFQPDWPASSPYVTTVGGTTGSGNNEVAASFSGGGFSNFFARPSYQDTAVTNFLNSGKVPNTKFFNSSSRGYPDIAAYAIDFEIYYDGGLTPVDGTSCAAPTASAIISLLNEVRLNNGLSSLGFLNPFLYGTAATTSGALFDITSGNNGDGCCPGFDCVPGWDPVTGLGSLNFAVLKDLVVSTGRRV